MEKGINQKIGEPAFRSTPSTQENFQSLKNFNLFDKNKMEVFFSKEKWSLGFFNQSNPNPTSKKIDYNEIQQELEGLFSDLTNKVRTLVTPLNNDINFQFDKKISLSAQTPKTSVDQLSQDNLTDISVSQKDEQDHEFVTENGEWGEENTCPVCFENFDNWFPCLERDRSQTNNTDLLKKNYHDKSEELMTPRVLLCGHIVCTGCIQDLLSPPGLACPVCFEWQDCESPSHLNIKNLNKVESSQPPAELSFKNTKTRPPSQRSKPSLFSDTDILSALSMSSL